MRVRAAQSASVCDQFCDQPPLTPAPERPPRIMFRGRRIRRPGPTRPGGFTEAPRSVTPALLSGQQRSHTSAHPTACPKVTRRIRRRWFGSVRRRDVTDDEGASGSGVGCSAERSENGREERSGHFQVSLVVTRVGGPFVVPGPHAPEHPGMRRGGRQAA